MYYYWRCYEGALSKENICIMSIKEIALSDSVTVGMLYAYFFMAHPASETSFLKLKQKVWSKTHKKSQGLNY